MNADAAKAAASYAELCAGKRDVWRDSEEALNYFKKESLYTRGWHPEVLELYIVRSRR